MAVHSFTLTANQESLYQKYLVAKGITDEEVMTKTLNSLIDQVSVDINILGAEKFKTLSVADKIAFLEN